MGIHKQRNDGAAFAISKFDNLFFAVVEANMLYGWPSVSGEVLPGLSNLHGVGLDRECDPVSSSVKCKPTIAFAFIFRAGDMKRGKAFEGGDVNKGHQNFGREDDTE